MRNAILGLALAAAVAAGCQRTGDGDYQVEVPDIDVSRDTLNVKVPELKLPDVDVDVRRDTSDARRRDTARDTIRDTTR